MIALVAVALLQAAGASSATAARDALLARCADCHPAESESYAGTGMARALEKLRPGELAGFAPLAEPETGFTYVFEGDGAGARVVETFAAPEGAGANAPPFRDSAPVAFAIGAGDLDRSFAVKRNGRFWLSPLEALGSGASRHASFAPGSAMAPGTRFTQTVTPECLACHTDAPPPRAWPLNLAVEGWEPRGIGCGACHGALLEHVAAREAELGGGERRSDPLAAERAFTRIQRMERCAACHLQGDARVELVAGRVGPPAPGSPLLATRAVFVAKETTDEIGFVSHVQRLVLSRCYLESANFPRGGLSCETCHDPHRSAFDAEERVRVRAACLQCHEPADTAAKRASDCALPVAERGERDCASCHMRATGVFDVAEIAIHDHWIRRKAGVPSPRVPLRFFESPSTDWRIFAWPDAPAPFPADDPGPWTMALAHVQHVERARAELARGEGTVARELAMLHHLRGSLFEGLSDFPSARAAYERALVLDPLLAETTVNLAPLLAQLGDPAAGKTLLDAVIARHPLADTAYRNRAAVRLALGDEPGFRADLEAALQLLPDAALAQTYARYLGQRGDAAGEQRWNARARKLDPRVP